MSMSRVRFFELADEAVARLPRGGVAGVSRAGIWAAALGGVERAHESFDAARGASFRTWALKNARWAMWEAQMLAEERRRIDWSTMPADDHAPLSVKAQGLTDMDQRSAAETRGSEAGDDVSWSEAREHLLAGLTERQLMLVEDRIEGRTIEEIARLDGIYPKWIERELEEIRVLVEARRRRSPHELRLEDLHERFGVRPRPRPVRRR